MNKAIRVPLDHLDPSHLRRIFGSFLTGVTIVTTIDGEGQPRGFTANSFTSVSLDPPLVLVCIDRKAASLRAFASCERFAINVLAESQRDLSSRFASKTGDKFAGVSFEKIGAGPPLLAGSLAWIDCENHQIVEVGDHVLLVGKVVSLHEGAGEPLGFFKGGYVSFSLERETPKIAPNTVFGCIVEHDGSVLLMREHDGSDVWTIPGAASTSAQAHMGGLIAKLDDLGVPVDVNFLYSVFELLDQRQTYIVYRGTVRERPNLRDCECFKFFSRDDLCWERLKHPQLSTMLRRYFDERDRSRFGVYVDSKDGGRVAKLEDAVLPFSSIEMLAQ
ncbi:flavin reductase [Mycoplana dimorpha]|uniref:Flavin reductase (DIM6/NTAB) family NADH-FMN oxidoreductase RutF n=1 Tax=Mycoplana dimorpha TaxID=28320 RepID=A0A2T5BAW8_MYCDI|nr:flavin reductase [Mycoplana dimorpha]PTM96132.1 flavin reductase (DIM6/NTAB) family NADH-FMN oxidoreductase RutF [Mycoplana dimorpha]